MSKEVWSLLITWSGQTIVGPESIGSAVIIRAYKNSGSPARHYQTSWDSSGNQTIGQ